MTVANPGALEALFQLDRAASRSRMISSDEWRVAGFALLALLVAQWTLSSALLGTDYDGGDGKMAQATILAAVKFSELFQVTTIRPIEGASAPNCFR